MLKQVIGFLCNKMALSQIPSPFQNLPIWEGSAKIGQSSLWEKFLGGEKK
jgi:hypothetical protein